MYRKSNYTKLKKINKNPYYGFNIMIAIDEFASFRFNIINSYLDLMILEIT